MLPRLIPPWARSLARPVYERLLNGLAGGHGIHWTINGETFRIDARCRGALARVYEPEVAEYLRRRVQPGETCIDVGANVGAYVLQLARWSAPDGRVVAFEPGPAAFGLLCRHVRMNGLGDRTVLVPAAAGEGRGTAVLHVAGWDGMSRLDAVNAALAEKATTLEVPVTTIDDYCESHGIAPDWMLIDVEGLEADVLLGSRKTIDAGKLRGIIAEFHPSIWRVPADREGGMGQVLHSLRLEPRPLRGQRDLFKEHGPVLLERHG